MTSAFTFPLLRTAFLANVRQQFDTKHQSNRISTLSPSPNVPSAPIAAMDYRSKVQILDIMIAPGPARLELRPRTWSAGRGLSARGESIVKWLLENSIAADIPEAVAMGTELVRSAGLIPAQRVDCASMAFLPSADRFYIHHAISVAPTLGLNVFLRGGFPGASRQCFVILAEMSALFEEIVSAAVVRDGREVVYEKIRRTDAWSKILVLASELQYCTIEDDVDEDVKKACLFNLYNIMIIHGKLVFGHPNDIAARGRFFNSVAYVIANHTLNSTELEHGVLRRKMEDDHPLAALKLAEKEPRMHFILNCGAQSCPPLVAVDIDDTENILAEQTKRFIQDNCEIDAIYRKIVVSRLWKWFRIDFTPDSVDDIDLLRWIALRAPANIKEMLDFLLIDMKAKEMKVAFMKYNWADNGDWNAKPDTALMAVYDYSFKKNA